MPKIAPQPIVLNDILLRIGTDEYEASVKKAQFDPTTPQLVWQGMTPGAIIPLTGEPTWKFTVDYPQDWATANALSAYLHAHRGTQVPVVLEPKAGGRPWTAAIVCEPGPIGGSLNTIAEGSVTMQVVGQPELGPQPA